MFLKFVFISLPTSGDGIMTVNLQPTNLPSSHGGKTVNPPLVIVQSPHAASRFSPESLRSSRTSTAGAATATKKSQHVDDQV